MCSFLRVEHVFVGAHFGGKVEEKVLGLLDVAADCTAVLVVFAGAFPSFRSVGYEVVTVTA